MKVHKLSLIIFAATSAVALPISVSVQRDTPSPDATMVEYALSKAPVSEKTKRFDIRENGAADVIDAATPLKRSNYIGGKLKPRGVESALPTEDIVKHPTEYSGRKLKTRDQRADAELGEHVVKRPNYYGGRHRTRELEHPGAGPEYGKSNREVASSHGGVDVKIVKHPDVDGGKRGLEVVSEIAKVKIEKQPEYGGGKRDEIDEDVVKHPTYVGGKRDEVVEDIVKHPDYDGGKRDEIDEDVVKHPDYVGGKRDEIDEDVVKHPDYVGGKRDEIDEDVVKHPDYVGGKRDEVVEDIVKHPDYDGGKRDEVVEDIVKQPDYDGGKRDEVVEDIVKQPDYNGGKR